MSESPQERIGTLNAGQLQSLYRIAVSLTTLESPAELAQFAMEAVLTATAALGATLTWPGLPQTVVGTINPDGAIVAVDVPNPSGQTGALSLHGSAANDPALSVLLAAVAELIGPALAQAQAMATLRQAEQAREQMINLLVHDIRSPLVATHASIEVTQRLLKGVDVTPTIFETLATGLRSVRSAVELCNDMLEVKRLQSGYRIDRRAFNVSELLSDVAQLLQHVAAQRDSRLAAMVQPANLEGSGDLRLLRRVMMNLAANAIRFTPPHEAVELAGSRDPEGGTRLTVGDRGPGIAPADHERVFEPFTQGNGEMSRGTGLGLHFCRQAVVAHGGRIWVENRNGGGCLFIVWLPDA